MNLKYPGVEDIELGSQADLALNLILSLTSCVALGKFLNLSELGFPVWKNSDDDICLGLLSQMVMSQKLVQCVLFASIPFSPSPASFREFKWSSHPAPTSLFQAQLSPQREAEAQPHKTCLVQTTCLWQLASDPGATFCPHSPRAPVPTLGLPWAPLEDGSGNSPSFVSDSFLCLGLDYVALGQLLKGRMWDPWSKLFVSCRKKLEPTQEELRLRPVQCLSALRGWHLRRRQCPRTQPHSTDAALGPSIPGKGKPDWATRMGRFK